MQLGQEPLYLHAYRKYSSCVSVMTSLTPGGYCVNKQVQCNVVLTGKVTIINNYSQGSYFIHIHLNNLDTFASTYSKCVHLY